MVSEVKKSSDDLWTIFVVIFGQKIWPTFKDILNNGHQNFFLQQFETPGYRHTQGAEISCEFKAFFS